MEPLKRLTTTSFGTTDETYLLMDKMTTDSAIHFLWLAMTELSYNVGIHESLPSSIMHSVFW